MWKLWNRDSKIALDVLILAFNPHVGAADGWIRRLLKGRPNVRRLTSEYGFDDSVFRSIRKHNINTIFLSVDEYFHFYGAESRLDELLQKTADFIERIRKDQPEIVFVLTFPSADFRSKFLAHRPGRFNHYLCLFSSSTPETVTEVLDKCELWHRRQYDYDVALSFAGEDRAIVEQVATCLTDNGAKVFYDRYEQADLIGKDLYQYFQAIYRHKARYCMVFASHNYANKLWTNHELKQAQARVFSKQQDYVLPVRLDDTEIPGVNETVAYLDARTLQPDQIADLVLKKLFHKSYRPRKRSI